jgi:hypothetical protein
MAESTTGRLHCKLRGSIGLFKAVNLHTNASFFQLIQDIATKLRVPGAKGTLILLADGHESTLIECVDELRDGDQCIFAPINIPVFVPMNIPAGEVKQLQIEPKVVVEPKVGEYFFVPSEDGVPYRVKVVARAGAKHKNERQEMIVLKKGTCCVRRFGGIGGKILNYSDLLPDTKKRQKECGDAMKKKRPQDRLTKKQKVEEETNEARKPQKKKMIGVVAQIEQRGARLASYRA